MDLRTRPPSELAARDLRVSFAQRHAQLCELHGLLARDADEDEDDTARLERRRDVLRFDFEWLDDVVGALALNALSVGPTGDAVCVPRLGALLNHCSEPNARLELVGRGRLAVFATRDIERGEQLTIDYVSCAAAKDLRESLLRPYFLEHLA